MILKVVQTLHVKLLITLCVSMLFLKSAIAAPAVVAIPFQEDAGLMVEPQAGPEPVPIKASRKAEALLAMVLKKNNLPAQSLDGDFRTVKHLSEHGICGEPGAAFILTVRVRYEESPGKYISRVVKAYGIGLVALESYRRGQSLPALRNSESCNFASAN